MAYESNESWYAAFVAMKDKFELTDDAIGIFAASLRFGLDDIRTISAEAITGGGDDKKCDLVYVDKEHQVAVLAQCYVARENKVAAPSNKASDLNTAISWLLHTDIDKLPDGLKGRAEELRAAIASEEIKTFHIWFVHNLPGSPNVKKELETVKISADAAVRKHNKGGVNIVCEELCSDRIKRLYEQAERTIIVMDEFEVLVPDAVVINGQEWSSVITVIPGSWLADIYKKHATDLFSANLRGYLGSRESDSNINNGIKRTASEEPDRFCVYNNGVTAIVTDYKLGKKGKSGRKLTIKGISIVNGAQTTGSIASSAGKLPDTLTVPARFVRASKDSIISNVVRYNNSQNKIQSADFRSNDQIQKRLRAEFEGIPDAEYDGGRRGGAADAIRRTKFAMPAYAVGQSLAAFHGDPILAYDKKSEIWDNEKEYRKVFTEYTTAKHIVFCYSLLSSIKDRQLELARMVRDEKTPLTQHELKILSFLNMKGASYLLVHVISQCMEIITGKPVPNRFDLCFKDNLSPASTQQLWNPITSLMLSISNQLEPAFSRNRITTDGVSKVVPNFTGVVASVHDLHKVTFSEFSRRLVSSPT